MALTEELVNKLSKIYPFSFLIGEDAFYIGRAVFRKCTVSEKELLLEYLKEFEKLHLHNFSLEKQDVRKLLRLFDEIIDNGTEEYSEEKEHDAKSNLHKQLSLCSQKELLFLKKQEELYIEANDYKDEAFYRHVTNDAHL